MHAKRKRVLHESVQVRTGGPGPTARNRGGRGRNPAGHGRNRSGGRRNRVSRGEVRNAVLVLLADEPMHGYQVMQELEERSSGGWQPSPGSIYPTLQQLADEDLIESRAEGGKNIFSLTEAGRAELENLDGPPAWERFRDDGPGAGMANLRRAMFQLGAATKQVAATGSERQVEAAEKILADARKSIYRLLAEDDAD